MCQNVCSRNVHKGYSKILSNKSKALTICCAIPRHAADNAWTTGADASGMPPEALSLQEREREREREREIRENREKADGHNCQRVFVEKVEKKRTGEKKREEQNRMKDFNNKKYYFALAIQSYNPAASCSGPHIGLVRRSSPSIVARRTSATALLASTATTSSARSPAQLLLRSP